MQECWRSEENRQLRRSAKAKALEALRDDEVLSVRALAV